MPSYRSSVGVGTVVLESLHCLFSLLTFILSHLLWRGFRYLKTNMTDIVTTSIERVYVGTSKTVDMLTVPKYHLGDIGYCFIIAVETNVPI